jgi:hypothetical protein
MAKLFHVKHFQASQWNPLFHVKQRHFLNFPLPGFLNPR